MAEKTLKVLVVPSGECLRGKGPPDRIVGKTGPSVSGSLYPLC